MASPDSLKATDRPIAFTLHNTNAGGGAPLVLPLLVRPEDLSITYPSRLAVTQTFGQDGAWADSFGQGVRAINLSGVTGWRGAIESGGGDGAEHFFKLHSLIISQWHLMRAAAAKAGKDPDKVLLILSDGLDNLNWVVAPQQFVLKRNKARPLLVQYNIALQRLSDHVSEEAAAGPGAAAKRLSAIDSLLACVERINDFAKTLKGMVNSVLGPIKAAIAKFVALTKAIASAVIGAVKAIVGVVSSVTSGLIEIMQGISQAGMNIAMTIAAVTTLPQQIRAEFQQLGSAYSSMMCVLGNVFKKRRFLPNFDINGSGNCASTAGGSQISPYASANTFNAVMASEKPGVKLSTPASNSLTAVLKADPVLNPLPLSALNYHTGVIVGGAAFA